MILTGGLWFYEFANCSEAFATAPLCLVEGFSTGRYGLSGLMLDEDGLSFFLEVLKL